MHASHKKNRANRRAFYEVEVGDDVPRAVRRDRRRPVLQQDQQHMPPIDASNDNDDNNNNNNSSSSSGEYGRGDGDRRNHGGLSPPRLPTTTATTITTTCETCGGAAPCSNETCQMPSVANLPFSLIRQHLSSLGPALIERALAANSSGTSEFEWAHLMATNHRHAEDTARHGAAGRDDDDRAGGGHCADRYVKKAKPVIRVIFGYVAPLPNPLVLPFDLAIFEPPPGSGESTTAYDHVTYVKLSPTTTMLAMETAFGFVGDPTWRRPVQEGDLLVIANLSEDIPPIEPSFNTIYYIASLPSETEPYYLLAMWWPPPQDTVVELCRSECKADVRRRRRRRCKGTKREEEEEEPEAECECLHVPNHVITVGSFIQVQVGPSRTIYRVSAVDEVMHSLSLEATEYSDVTLVDAWVACPTVSMSFGFVV
ncbi:MAG: hypothetical protein WC763_06720 [Candidatus Paceibacterota bacterium]|jgi:hypothetical protein